MGESPLFGLKQKDGEKNFSSFYNNFGNYYSTRPGSLYSLSPFSHDVCC